MRNFLKCSVIIIFPVIISCLAGINKAFGALPTITEKTRGMNKYPGFFPFYWDEEAGKLWLEVNKWDESFLYYNAIAAGMGSNDIGLDRGRINNEHVVKFVRSGPKVMLVEPNLEYRALSENPEEVKAVGDAFAKSILWGFQAEAEEGDKVLIDITDFVVRDAFDAVSWIEGSGQGSYQLDKSRSAVFLSMTKNFPKNSEFETTLTLVTDDTPGNYVRDVTPTPDAVTIRQHFSFVELPDAGYEPREFDPRAGMGKFSYQDYATPIGQPLEKKFIRRHRLEKKNPEAEVSEAVEPIVYYLDPGTPEPVRSALMEGASWWNQAFEAAGYKNAFQIKILPEDADPLDIRYNYIQWVHRSTRGWSYGRSVIDPRTGEIIKGKVTLGSLRIRQDFLIAQGLIGNFRENGSNKEELLEMALARIRQLSAHEVGHTLGLPHNYASTYNGRASVMDYPHPLVEIDNGNLDLSNAYDTGIGEWDKIAIKYAYQDFPENTSQNEGLGKIIAQALDANLKFMSDQDARPAGSAHPYAHLWDNGSNATEGLQHVMEVREIALNNFGEQNIPMGASYASLEDVLVPIYLFHRYQTEAACKVIGGLYYNYALRGDGQYVTKMVPPDEQKAAIDVVLGTLDPSFLTLPENILELIPPRPYGKQEKPRETFDGKTSVTFDPLAGAEASADMTLTYLLQHERAARLIQYHSRNPELPGFGTLLDRVIDKTWKAEAPKGLEGEVYRVVGSQVIAHMMKLIENENASGQVRALTALKLGELKQWINSNLEQEQNEAQKAHLKFNLSIIKNFERSYEHSAPNVPSEIPDGSPIGDTFYNFLNKQECGY